MTGGCDPDSLVSRRPDGEGIPFGKHMSSALPFVQIIAIHQNQMDVLTRHLLTVNHLINGLVWQQLNFRTIPTGVSR